MNSTLSSLRLRPYETQVLLLVAFLGSARLVLALVLDLLNPAITLTELLTDLGLLVIFSGILIAGLKKANFKSVHPSIGAVLILLLALNFVEFGGAAGVSRYNYYCGFFVIILLYAQRSLVVLLSFQLVVLVAATAATYFQMEWTQAFLIAGAPLTLDFLFAVISLGILSYYLKVITLAEIHKLDLSNERLRQQVNQAKQMNARLISQGKELLAAQLHLEEEVLRRTKALEKQQHAIEKYIYINTRVLQEPITNLNNVLNGVVPTDTVSTMLVLSKKELNDVFGRIKVTLESEEELHRTKIKPA